MLPIYYKKGKGQTVPHLAYLKGQGNNENIKNILKERKRPKQCLILTILKALENYKYTLYQI